MRLIASLALAACVALGTALASEDLRRSGGGAYGVHQFARMPATVKANSKGDIENNGERRRQSTEGEDG